MGFSLHTCAGRTSTLVASVSSSVFRGNQQTWLDLTSAMNFADKISTHPYLGVVQSQCPESTISSLVTILSLSICPLSLYHPWKAVRHSSHSVFFRLLILQISSPYTVSFHSSLSSLLSPWPNVEDFVSPPRPESSDVVLPESCLRKAVNGLASE